MRSSILFWRIVAAVQTLEEELEYTRSVCDSHLEGLHARACMLVMNFTSEIYEAKNPSHLLNYWFAHVLPGFTNTPLIELLSSPQMESATDTLRMSASESDLAQSVRHIVQAVRSFAWRIFTCDWIFSSGLLTHISADLPPPQFILAADPTPGYRWDVASQLLHWLSSTTPLKAVEVGVFRGEFSKFILGNNKNVYLHGIDPYLDDHTIPPEYGGSPEEYFYEAKIIYDKYAGRALLHRITSEAAAISLFSDRSIDFVFIDGCHTAVCIEADLRSWIPKIKNGGIVMGHDFSSVLPAVPITVSRLRQGLPLHLGMDLTWWFYVTD